ncbi:glycoside hydrolase family 2 protein [Pedobacter africanus]|nr:glycoside hydrolase family 2 TIM barrel-domain containing protein [Pedobacter africanus]
MQYKKIIAFILLISWAVSGYGSNARQILPLNKNWQFYFAYNFEQNIEKQKVNLPHTWNAEETLKGIANYNRTSAIYENTLTVTDAMKGKRLFLYFEGANSVATILLNNKFVDEHKGGYTGFCIEITKFVGLGANALTVQVSNAYRLDVIPLHGDFNVYGGIHRPVSLIVTDQDCISLLDHGSSGVYISQQQVSPQSAKINVLSKMSVGNHSGLSLKTTIYDREKNVVASSVANITDANSKEARQDISISNPRLWNGKADPYLYTVEVSLLKNDQLIDQVSQPLGLRFFQVDPDKGFFLNGKYLDLYGAGRHEDLAGKGSALSDADHENDMELIKELGATAMRLTHYPQNKHFYDMCDRNGIILWSEIPFVGPGGYTGTGYLKNKELEANIRTMLIELIRQNFNHPSICFWGMFNELKLNYDDPQPFIKELNTLAKQEDPGRLTTLASNLEPEKFNGLTDLMGWNKYYGWYGGNFDEVGKWADDVHRVLPFTPISVSEYGAGASPFKHTEVLTKPAPTGRFHPEEWQTAFHEKHWEALKRRTFVWGKFVWVLADFGSSIRTEGDRTAINDKGLVTYDRKVKKDAFYFYKANWNPEPMLYIAERRNNIRYSKTAAVKVFCNAGTVSLWVNGKIYPKKVPNDLKTILWQNIKLQPGKNTILVRSVTRGKVLEDSCVWNQI